MLLRKPFPILLSLLLLPSIGSSVLTSCESEKPPVAPAIVLRDSVPIMTTYGVSKLISDSGVIRYKIIAEEWKVYDKTNPKKQTFNQGLFLEKFNQQFHVEMYITADTAYWFNENLWELRGRVCVWKEDGTIFNSNLLYWDMQRHEFYSNQFSRLTSPSRTVQGASFHSNEQMTQYEVDVTSASFPLPEQSGSNEPTDTTSVSAVDSAQLDMRKHIQPQRASEKPDPNLPKGHFK